jgi:hypothetical protein
MRLEQVLCSLLVAPIVGAVAGCGWLCRKGYPFDETFSETWGLSALDLDALRTEATPILTCEELCVATNKYFYYLGSEVSSFEVSSCETDIDLPLSDETGAEQADTAGQDSGDASAGSITCAGRVTGVHQNVCKGRRPLGHQEPPCPGPTPVARQLAAMASLEAAAVLAFEELADWLVRHGAPPSLVERCVEAAEDERRHARIIGALARAQGAEPPAPVATVVDADLFAVALHNAVEGCVHESWAAVEAHWQVGHAPLEARRLFARIAADELRHGQLAWDLHDWLLAQLSPADRDRVLGAQSEALRNLPLSVPQRPDALGQPWGPSGQRLARDFARGVAAQSELPVAHA